MSTTCLTNAILGASLSLLASTVAVAAPMRGGQPAVLDSATEELQSDDGSAAVVDAFRRRYNKLGRPPIALFWNHELSDRIAQSLVQRTAVQGSKSETASESAGDGGKRASRQENTSQTTDVSTFAPTAPSRAGLDERSEARLRGAFLSTLSTGGLRLLDRSMMVRTAATQASGAADVQGNESRALQRSARFVMEVLLVSDPQEPLAVGFNVSIKDVSSSAIVFSEYLSARPALGKGAWVAVNGGQGFERAAPAPVSIEDVGRTLGLTVMGKLAAVW